jgi:hypothetical protein
MRAGTPTRVPYRKILPNQPHGPRLLAVLLSCRPLFLTPRLPQIVRQASPSQDNLRVHAIHEIIEDLAEKRLQIGSFPVLKQMMFAGIQSPDRRPSYRFASALTAHYLGAETAARASMNL